MQIQIIQKRWKSALPGPAVLEKNRNLAEASAWREEAHRRPRLVRAEPPAGARLGLPDSSYCLGALSLFSDVENLNASRSWSHVPVESTRHVEKKPGSCTGCVHRANLLKFGRSGEWNMFTDALDHVATDQNLTLQCWSALTAAKRNSQVKRSGVSLLTKGPWFDERTSLEIEDIKNTRKQTSKSSQEQRYYNHRPARQRKLAKYK